MAKIMIVDDEVMITQTLSQLIELTLDAEVFTYNDPTLVVQSQVLIDHRFDVVISDFMMPKLSGIDFLKAVKKAQPEIVPILLTGYSDKENAIKSINEVGLYYYLEKPWDNTEIVKVLQNGLEKRALQDQVRQDMHEITRLYDILKKDFSKEQDKMVDVVVTLANLIEAKDSYTDGHTRRVADLCALLGRRVGLSEETIKYLEISGIIHDIGKVGTPELILNKPSALDDKEFLVMKHHPEIGAKILRPLVALEPCLHAVRHHHEKLDGSGYPDGLKAEAIPIETRIVSIADIFDALYSDRPYRAKMPIDKAMAIVQKEADRGTLDKDLVDLLQQLVESGEIARLYGEA